MRWSLDNYWLRLGRLENHRLVYNDLWRLWLDDRIDDYRSFNLLRSLNDNSLWSLDDDSLWSLDNYWLGGLRFNGNWFRFDLLNHNRLRRFNNYRLGRFYGISRRLRCLDNNRLVYNDLRRLRLNDCFNSYRHFDLLRSLYGNWFRSFNENIVRDLNHDRFFNRPWRVEDTCLFGKNTKIRKRLRHSGLEAPNGIIRGNPSLRHIPALRLHQLGRYLKRSKTARIRQREHRHLQGGNSK